MNGDDEGQAFQLPLNVPSYEMDDDERDRALEWLQALAEQLASADGKKLSIELTGVYVDDYDDGDDGDVDDDDDVDDGGDEGVGGDEGAAGGKAVKRNAAQKKAAFSFMVCPGRRPYG